MIEGPAASILPTVVYVMAAVVLVAIVVALIGCGCCQSELPEYGMYDYQNYDEESQAKRQALPTPSDPVPYPFQTGERKTPDNIQSQLAPTPSQFAQFGGMAGGMTSGIPGGMPSVMFGGMAPEMGGGMGGVMASGSVATVGGGMGGGMGMMGGGMEGMYQSGMGPDMMMGQQNLPMIPNVGMMSPVAMGMMSSPMMGAAVMPTASANMVGMGGMPVMGMGGYGGMGYGGVPMAQLGMSMSPMVGMGNLSPMNNAQQVRSPAGLGQRPSMFGMPGYV